MSLARRARSVTTLVAVLVLALAGAACGDDDGPAPDRADPPTTQPTTEPAPTTEPEAPDTTADEAPTTTDAPQVPVVPDSVRGVWVHLFDDSLKSPAGVDQVLDEVASSGLDTVFVQVARRHDAYYRSDVLPPTPDPGLAPGFDVLEAVTAGADRLGLSVHAWITVAPALHALYDQLTLPPGHLWLDHGPDSSDPWTTVSHTGTQSREYLDVGLLELHEHTARVVAEIAQRYPVDGVHLDYVRYDGAEWGYHPRALARFAAETGRTDRPPPGDAEWSAWRRAQTQAFMATMRDAVQAARPGTLLSAAVIAQGAGPSAAGGFAGTHAYTRMQQDWPAWLDAGVVDVVVPMAYHREQVGQQQAWFRQWVEFSSELGDRHPERAVAVGVGAWLNSRDAGLTQVGLATDRTAGMVLFSYQQDTASDPPHTLLRAL